ncbi:MAG: HAMP domain-containing histidine kinase [Gemmataceae bacterium]|nr:HAMP domain-containing histidine kinase [Gemmataceae bacterium]
MHRFRHFWRFFRPLLVPILVVGLAVVTLREPVAWWLGGEEKYDQEALKEWLLEAKVYQTLPHLVAEYRQLHRRHGQLKQRIEAGGPRDEFRDVERELAEKRQEIEVHLNSLGDPPTKMYRDRLPLFPVIYRLEVRFDDGLGLGPIDWDSKRARQPGQYKELTGVPLGPGAWADVQYQLRVYARQQYNEREAVTRWLRLSGLAVILTAAALLWIYLAQRREGERERQRVLARQQVTEAERKRLEEELRRQEAERRREEAERTALELKSQLFANIGIMAGSYAHNIKNLLVRPNDLLGRCLERDGLSGEQEQMLHEVRHTLGTVTERLQQILLTVRRDPSQSEPERLDLNDLVRDVQRTWADLGREKWKFALRVDAADEPLWISGDRSHLQQALENLLFNARDATFEMRNHLRDQARQVGPRDTRADAERRQALIAAAGWQGEVVLRVRRAGDRALLEVSDNGIGMTAEVRRRCTETHFSTKRDNALFAGLSAGMGLGLSFVVVILEHHGAALEIESEPHHGTTFRIHFPLTTTAAPTSAEPLAETSRSQLP